MLPRLSKIEYTILDLLRSGREMYGLEMVQASDGKLKRGTIYVTLARMGEKGYLTSKTSELVEHAGMPRPKYQVTGLGQRVLSATDAAEAHFAGTALNV